MLEGEFQIFVILFSPPSRYKVQFIDADSANDSGQKYDEAPTTAHQSANEEHPFYARVISNERMTADDHWQNVRLMRFDISQSGMR